VGVFIALPVSIVIALIDNEGRQRIERGKLQIHGGAWVV
jgi:hypothetical protein